MNVYIKAIADNKSNAFPIFFVFLSSIKRAAVQNAKYADVLIKCERPTGVPIDILKAIEKSSNSPLFNIKVLRKICKGADIAPNVAIRVINFPDFSSNNSSKSRFNFFEFLLSIKINPNKPTAKKVVT